MRSSSGRHIILVEGGGGVGETLPLLLAFSFLVATMNTLRVCVVCHVIPLLES
jgi:hypothetical protein